MDSGYYSAQAVRDLLAVKDGEIQFLKNNILLLQQQLKQIQSQNSPSTASNPSN